MATSGMYSDELTLRAVPYLLNVELNILPAVVRDGRLLVAPINSIARAGFTLDHFAEDQVLYNLVRERNQDYFQYNLTDEDETVNNSINNKLYVIKYHSSETIRGTNGKRKRNISLLLTKMMLIPSVFLLKRLVKVIQ